jgi:hypothetical protein
MKAIDQTGPAVQAGGLHPVFAPSRWTVTRSMPAACQNFRWSTRGRPDPTP